MGWLPITQLCLTNLLLDLFPSATDSAEPAQRDRRRIAILLSFVQAVCLAKASPTDPAPPADVQTLVGKLIGLQSTLTTDAMDGSLNISEIANASVDAAARLLSVSSFAEALVPLLQGEDRKVRHSHHRARRAFL